MRVLHDSTTPPLRLVLETMRPRLNLSAYEKAVLWLAHRVAKRMKEDNDLTEWLQDWQKKHLTALRHTIQVIKRGRKQP